MDFLGDLKDAINTSLDAIQKVFSASAPTVTTSCATCECVHTITASVASTSGVRKSTDIRPVNVLKASSTSDESLTGNAPVILVRGCKEVMLAAVTTPKDKPVTWSVKPNENSDAPPTVTPYDGGRKAKLETNVHGSFSVTATLGSCKVVWNVVFVWVKVDVKSSVIMRRNNKYADNGSTASYTKFRSGLFATGQYPWEARVKVKVIGGGVSKTLGTGKVKLHILQNAVTDTLAGNYASGEKAEEVPKGGLPIRDSNGAANPWADDNYSPTVTPDNISVKREVATGDSPTGGFLTSHPKTGSALQSVSGVNAFIAAIASVSDDAPNAYMVHAKTAWSADFGGNVNSAGTYTPTSASTTKEAAFSLISPSTGGKDAGEAGFETFEPRFNGGTDTKWTP